MEPFNRTLPGPTDYESPKIFYDEISKQSFSKASRMAMLKPIDPGPGSYEISDVEKPKNPRAL